MRPSAATADQNEVVDRVVNLKSIPQDLIVRQSGLPGSSRYYTADMTAEFEVSKGVKMRLKFASTLVESYNTSL